MRKNKVTIIHKSSCSKSNEGMCVLKDVFDKDEIKVIEYMINPLTVDEIKSLLKKLKIPAEKLVRKKELLYKEKYADKDLSEEQWVKVLSENPILIERPIIIKGRKAIIGRPTEVIAEFLKDS